jgi:4-amino-4-deoxy-L-arabinose transferase-like glycosyltransferase
VTEPSALRTGLVLAGIALLGGGLRLAVTEAVMPPGLVGDELYYVGTATQLAATGEHYYPPYGVHAAWPPAFPWLLSRSLTPRGSGLDVQVELAPALYQQVAIGTLLILATAALAWALFGRSEALVAAALAAVYPTFVAYSHFLWSEAFFATLLTLALVGVVWGQRRQSAWGAAATGLVFGISALTREVGLVLAFVCAVWWVLTAAPAARRGAAVRGALMLAAACLVILPWTLRNYAALERIVPVSTAGWLNARSGNTLSGDSWLRADLPTIRVFRNAFWNIPGEMERSDFARDQTLALIRSEQPLWIFKKLVRTTALLFAPDSFVFKKISRGAYDDVPPRIVHWIVTLVVGAYLLVVLAGVPGVAAAPGPGRRTLPCLLVGATLALHVFLNASSRYRVPLMPLLMAYAAWAWLHRQRLLESMSRRSRWAAIGVLAIFLGFCLPYFVPEVISLWTRGTYMDPGRP